MRAICSICVLVSLLSAAVAVAEPERLPLPGAVSAYRSAIQMGFEDAEFMFFKSPGFGQPALVIRFVPRNWRNREREVPELFNGVIGDLEDVDPFIAVISARNRLSTISDDPTASGDWLYWRLPDNTWRLVDNNPASFLGEQIDATDPIAAPYDRSYWEWHYATLLAAGGNARRALDIATTAHARILSLEEDPLQLRVRTNEDVIRLLHRTGDRERMLPYLQRMARLAGTESIGLADFRPFVSTEPQLSRRARNMSEQERAAARVLLRFTVTRHGTVDAVEVLEEQPDDLGLAQSAAEAVRQWLFLPRLENGEPVDTPNVSYMVTF